MPTPIIHLCTAKKMLDNLSVQDTANFYLGSISPDAFYLTPTYHDIEGKHHIHLTAHLTDQDFNVWKKRTQDFINQKNKQDINYDFYFGYAVHILTDIFWKENIFNSFVSKCSAEGKSYEDIRIIHYNDAEKYDLEYYERFDLKSDVWNYLSACKSIGVQDLVTAEEVSSWNKNTLSLFDNNEDKRNNPPIYFSYDIISDFICAAAGDILKLLKE